MNEIDKLLEELRGMKSEGKQSPQNNADTWSHIANRDWEKAGFANEEECKAWILDHPYSNL